MQIGIDIDGVIIDFKDVMVDYINNKHGTNICINDFKKYNDNIDGIVVKDEVWHLFNNNSDILKDIPDIKDASLYINKLYNKEHIIKIVTHRPAKILSETLYSLSKHLIPYHSFIMCNSYSKATADIDILIDDKIENIIDICETNRYGVLFLQPWNKNQINELCKYMKGGKAFVCDNWEVIYNLIKSLEKEFINA